MKGNDSQRRMECASGVLHGPLADGPPAGSELSMAPEKSLGFAAAAETMPKRCRTYIEPYVPSQQCEACRIQPCEVSLSPSPTTCWPPLAEPWALQVCAPLASPTPRP